eukprot:2263040-Pyramimonas_sp.AAC.2
MDRWPFTMLFANPGYCPSAGDVLDRARDRVRLAPEHHRGTSLSRCLEHSRQRAYGLGGGPTMGSHCRASTARTG